MWISFKEFENLIKNKKELKINGNNYNIQREYSNQIVPHLKNIKAGLYSISRNNVIKIYKYNNILIIKGYCSINVSLFIVNLNR